MRALCRDAGEENVLVSENSVNLVKEEEEGSPAESMMERKLCFYPLLLYQADIN